MKKCSNPGCGAEIEDYMERCPYCGLRQTSMSLEEKVEKWNMSKTMSHSGSYQHQATGSNDKHKRNAFITFWLWLGLIGNVVGGIYILITPSGFINLFTPSGLYLNIDSDVAVWLRLSAGFALFAAWGCFLLLNWVKMGFFVYSASVLVNVLMGALVSGTPIWAMAPIAVGIVVMFGVLHLRKNGVAYWDALE